MLRFNLERLNHLEFVDASEPSTEQGPRDLLVTDMKHPIFGNFWRPGHIIGYEHTFIAALAQFLDCRVARRAISTRTSPTAWPCSTALDALSSDPAGRFGASGRSIENFDRALNRPADPSKQSL